jgi:hypothetical protein
MNVVIDSGTMITFSSTCLMNVFVRFARENRLELIVSHDVSEESVWRPLSNKRFALNAARIKHLFNESIVRVISATHEVKQLEKEILSLANNCFFSKGKPIQILQRGEAEALALAKIHNAKALFVDERTVRSLIENPSRLKQVLEKRQHKVVKADEKCIADFRKMFSDLKIFRSVDIIALAFEQGSFDGELDKGQLELEAALYATKFAGCAVSEKEIQDYLKHLT